MGACKLCGSDAGWFKHEHPECREKKSKGFAEIYGLALRAATSGEGKMELAAEAEGIARRSFLSDTEVRLLFAQVCEKAIQDALADDVLSADEEDHISDFVEAAGVRADMNGNRAWLRLVQAGS
ncbi:MAG: hypothetical protein ACRD2R_02720, partial [Terriglobales bacterium]